MSNWNDFNDARSTTSVIPKGAIAKVRLSIRPGGYDDPSQGWTGGYATRGSTGAVYLNAEFTVLEGPYARRKIFSLIGLYSPKGPDWGNMGRALVRTILNSARGISDKDVSPQAQSARRIRGLSDLDGIEFVAKIDVGTDANGEEKNEIRMAVTPDHRGYSEVMGQQHLVAGPRPAAASQGYAPPVNTPPPAVPAMQQGGFPAQAQQPAAGADPRPAWAR